MELVILQANDMLHVIDEVKKIDPDLYELLLVSKIYRNSLYVVDRTLDEGFPSVSKLIDC